MAGMGMQTYISEPKQGRRKRNNNPSNMQRYMPTCGGGTGSFGVIVISQEGVPSVIGDNMLYQLGKERQTG